MMTRAISDIKEYWRRSRWLKFCLVLVLLLWLALLGIKQAWYFAQYREFLRTRKLPGPTWRGLTVGQSTFDDVRVIVGESPIIKNEDGQISYGYQEPGQPYPMNRIVIRDGLVEWIQDYVMSYQQLEVIMLTEFVDRYGPPDSVQWSTSKDGRRVVIFLDDGVFVQVSSTTEFENVQVIEAFYYRPRPLRQVLRDFSAYVTEFGASGSCSDFDCVFWGPKDPWYGGYDSPWPDWVSDWLFP